MQFFPHLRYDNYFLSRKLNVRKQASSLLLVTTVLPMLNIQNVAYWIEICQYYQR